MTRLYEDLQQLNAHLEAQVSHRTLELEQSREQLRQLNARLQDVREAERTHLSREIHDQLGGSLTGLKMDIVMLRKTSGDKSDSLREQLDALSNTIDNNIKLVRQIASDLRPSLLDDFGLVAALEWELQEFQKRSGLECQLKANTEVINLDRNITTAAFRIFQEALTNIVRHAQATKVTVELEEQTNNLLLRIHDNGRGISTGQLTDSKSLGLVGMRERVRLLNGQIEISGGHQQGTTVTVRLPITPQPTS
jgi:signal transduction histidine kinase